MCNFYLSPVYTLSLCVCVSVCLSVHLCGRIVFGEMTPRDEEGMTPVHCAAQYCRPRHLELMGQGEG